ncbi:MAG: class I SAM-dependent methyltransferase [Promethearchaeota archaeon]
MKKNNLKEFDKIRKKWNNRAKTYNDFYKTFRGAVESYVDWELLKNYLPKSKEAKILDAAGGTGRISIILAKRGYSITLCDISPEMLNLAKQNMLKEGVADSVKILECNVCNLQFEDENFDLVICWDGMVDQIVIRELNRVTKKDGIVSIYLNNKWAKALKKFYEDPNLSLNLIKSCSSSLEERKKRHFSPEEAKNLFEREGFKVLDIYGVCHWTRILNIPYEIQEAENWDANFFKQTTNMVLKLSNESSVKGISKHLVVYGKKV